MRKALDPRLVQEIYDDRSAWYDFYHGLATLRSDQRGRKLVIQWGVGEGDAVLDAGGGTGTTGLLAARAVGSTGKVTVFDLSEGMLDQGRRKAAALGLEDRMEFIAGDLLDMPFADASFDSVLSTYSLCPVYDPMAGARELYRVLRPSGRLTAAHSADPKGPIAHWMADTLEKVIWRFPSITLGCRAVSVLPELLDLGAELKESHTLGLPFMPFLVFSIEKPKP